MKILVTGGLGFIGSHTCCELLDNGYDIVVCDNLSNSKEEVYGFIKDITGKNFPYYNIDVCNYDELSNVFNRENIDAVIHFAGYKAVGESVKKPLMYYENNLFSTINLLKVMGEHNCHNIIFSSSATIYGVQDNDKLVETMKRGETTNPYGTTKSMIEKILEDLYYSDNNWNITILRYFNPAGAHSSGLIGENPNGIPNNLMPYIVKVASGELDHLTIFGNDYDTPDGTCIRDYIHVVDLAKGHLAALSHSINNGSNLYIYNLGSGKGVSVTEMVSAFEKANNLKLKYVYGERREGDLPVVFADPSKALKELGWKTEHSLEDICRDSYNYALKHLDK